MTQREELRDLGPFMEPSDPGFMERVFGPGNDLTLARFAEQCGRDVEDGGYFGDSSLTFSYRGLHCSIVPKAEFNPATKVMDHSINFIVDYVPVNGFQLNIENEGLLSGLAKLFGSTDFEIGDINFDKEFYLDSNDNERLRTICGANGLRRAMLEAGDCTLSTEEPGWFSDVPDGMRRLHYKIEGEISSLEMLNKQLQAFADVIDGLFQTGCVKTK